jgi:hypothetical protein
MVVMSGIEPALDLQRGNQLEIHDLPSQNKNFDIAVDVAKEKTSTSRLRL